MTDNTERSKEATGRGVRIFAIGLAAAVVYQAIQFGWEAAFFALISTVIGLWATGYLLLGISQD